MAIVDCEYSFIDSRLDGIDNFIASVGNYAKNTECSLAQAFRELSLYAYKWVLGHFDRRKAHCIHHNVICHSFFWLAFAKAYADRSKPGRNKYDPERMARNLAQGQTAMLQMGDPLDCERTLFVTLGQLFDDVRHQKLAVGDPCCPDYSKQEDEIVTHLAKLTRDKRNDSVWLPASVPDAKQVLNPQHPWYSYDDSARYVQCDWAGSRDRSRSRDRSQSRNRSRSRDRRMPLLEAAERDMTQASAPESTDTEMHQALEKELLICSDYQAGLVRNAAQAIEEVMGGDMRSVQFREPAEEEEEEETPRFLGTRDRNRGQSILKKMTANSAGAETSTMPRQPHKIGDVPRGVGSPLNRHPFKTYDWYSRLKQSQSSCRKQERQVVPKPPGGTPTQSPLQKSGRLQSVVSVVKKEARQDRGASRDPVNDIPVRWHNDRTFESAPYHLCGSPEDKAEAFVLYITDKFGRGEFQDEVEDFGNVFGHRTAFVARFSAWRLRCISKSPGSEATGGCSRTSCQKWKE